MLYLSNVMIEMLWNDMMNVINDIKCYLPNKKKFFQNIMLETPVNSNCGFWFHLLTINVFNAIKVKLLLNGF